MSTPWSPAAPSIVARCPIARKRSATKTSNCGPLIARTISKRLASSRAVGVFGSETLRTSQTTVATVPTSTSSASQMSPFMVSDNPLAALLTQANRYFLGCWPREASFPHRLHAPTILRGLLSGELALLGDETAQPGEAGFVPEGAFGVHVPVEGLAVVAEAPVQFAYKVGGHGELPPVESLFPQGADEVAEGSELEGALEGVLALLAADPRGAEAEVAQVAGPQGSLLAADLGGVEGEPRRGARAEDFEEAVLLEALLDVVAFVEGQVEVSEVFSGGEGARRAHGYAVPYETRPVRLAYRELGTEIRLPSDGDVAPDGRRAEDVAT